MVAAHPFLADLIGFTAPALVPAVLQGVRVGSAAIGSDVAAGVCPVPEECQGEGVCDPVSVHDQEQKEPVCSYCHERSRSSSGDHSDGHISCAMLPPSSLLAGAAVHLASTLHIDAVHEISTRDAQH